MENEIINKKLRAIEVEAERATKEIEKAFEQNHWQIKRILVDFVTKYNEIWNGTK